jgi:hypothetical protein
MKNEGEISETGLVHPLTHNNEGENFTFYEAESQSPSKVVSQSGSRITSREPSQTSEQPRRESLVSESLSEPDLQTHGFLDEPEHTRLPIPVIKIFDKNECFIDWRGAAAWVTKDLTELAQKYFPEVSRQNFVVIDNDPHTYNRNKRQAMPINTYWGSTYDDELEEIMVYLRDVYLPSTDRSQLDLQLWNSKEEPEDLASMM